MRILHLLFLVAALLLCSCSKRDWWVGTWTIDQEKTKEHVSATPENPLAGLLGGLALIALDGAEMKITSDEIITMKDGSGKALSYKVLERPSPNSVILKVGENVSTYTLEGEYLTTTSSGGAQVKIYFKRIK